MAERSEDMGKKGEQEKSFQRNFIVKVKDAGPKDLKEALKAKDINVVSVMEIYREELSFAGNGERERRGEKK